MSIVQNSVSLSVLETCGSVRSLSREFFTFYQLIIMNIRNISVSFVECSSVIGACYEQSNRKLLGNNGDGVSRVA